MRNRIRVTEWIACVLLAFLLFAPATHAAEKLVFWHIQTTEPTKGVIDRAVERFRRDHPDIEVEVVAIQNDPYKTRLAVAMGAGDPPDVFHSWGGGWLKTYVDEGMVLDLTEELDRDNWKDHYAPAALNMASFDGRNFGVPLDLSVVLVWYNKALFEQHGWEPPKTYGELLTLIDKIKAAGVTPFALANKTKWPGAFYLIYLADRIGGPEAFLNAFNRVPGYTFDSEVFVEAGARIQELVRAGAFPQGFNGLDYDTGQSRVLFYSGRAAMIIQGSWLVASTRGEAPEFAPNLDFFTFPAVEGGAGDPSNVVGGANVMFSVSSTTKMKDEAITLLKYLTAAETAADWAATGRLPAVRNVAIDDPLSQRMAETLGKAGNLQLYYDQFLPPVLGELHKDTTQAIFGLTMTPEEAARAMEELAKEEL